ncbi:ubiquitin carboxyl-terminal hydrolase 17-like [Typha angustifolia]|uniref:ubiquitin carboxyl-terminal hydrolase 17-like n=1 Tax=Typha angustifolia TaxID=59011 RepID=UPI003C2D1D28
MGDLVLSGPLLVLLVVWPVVALVVRRRWRLAATRREEVRRLALLAAAEAERIEFEASLEYAADLAAAVAAPAYAAVVAPPPGCAVCFSPTTTRCSRCKAVKYCSGKCQIIHWRQGHKEECRPPHDIDKNNGHLRVSDSKKVQVEQSGSSANKLVFQEEPLPRAAETFPDGPESYDTNCILNRDDKDEDKPSNDASRAEETVDSFHVLLKPSSSSGSGTAETSIDHPASENHTVPHNDEVRDSLSCETHNNPRAAVEGQDANLNSKPTDNPGLSSPVNTISSLKNSKGRVFTSEDKPVTGKLSTERTENSGRDQEAAFGKIGESIGTDKFPDSHKRQDDRKPAVLDAQSPTHFSDKLFGSNSSVCDSSITTDSSSGAASSECEAQYEHKEKQALVTGKSKNFISSAYVSSTNKLSHIGRNSVATDALRNVGNAPKDPVRSSNSTNAIPNGLTTSFKQVVKQFASPRVLRHYPSELMLFPYDRFVKLYNAEKVYLHPCGLTNCGNSCYANVVLQCLTFTRPLTTYLLEGLHSKLCLKTEWCFICELESLVMMAKQGKTPLSPIGILSHLRDIGSNFGPGIQEDAHEFLRYVVDAMQLVCLKEAGPNATMQLTEQTTLIQLIFGGTLQSKIRCLKCNGKSEHPERMMDLTVEIHGDIGSLEEALLRFTSPEILDGENKYQCTRCKSYERARKRLTILEAPNILTIALKRFQAGKFGKLNKAVRFPEYLDLAQYMSGTDDKSPVYRLYGVVVHIDVMNAAFSGHYVCYVKDTQGNWYKIDDSKVKRVTLGKVLSKNAYMLLYARCSPRSPSSVRNAMPHETLRPRLKKKKSKTVSFYRTVHQDSKTIINASHQTMDDPRNLNSLDLSAERSRYLMDSSSDNSSLLSCSDEGSWSTESTRDSSSIDMDFYPYSEHLSGELEQVSWNNSPSRLPEEIDCFSYSPLSSRYSSEAVSNGLMSDSPRSDTSISDASLSSREEAGEKPLDSKEEWNEAPSVLIFNRSKQSRNFTEQCRSVETDRVNSNAVKTTGMLSRRPTVDKTAQTFYW